MLLDSKMQDLDRRVSTTLRHMFPEFIEFYFLSWAVC
jgi:hypothetical protein